MASITKQASGKWRALVRRKGQVISETFIRWDTARQWATEMEALIDSGQTPIGKQSRPVTTFAELIDLHLEDMAAIGKAPGQSKVDQLNRLKRELGKTRVTALDRLKLIDYGRKRAANGVSPGTLNGDIGAIKLVVSHAAAVQGMRVAVDQIDMARIALKRLGLVGKGVERDRRPTNDELTRIIAYLEARPTMKLPGARIVKFAVATAMRLDEIFRVTWGDLNENEKLLTIRDRKDPRLKKGNDQPIPLLSLTGFDALALLNEQRSEYSHPEGRIFPYWKRSATAAFQRACARLGIEDLHFHDLRHEATSRLFEAGLSIQQVALVTGHKDWKMLQRYTHLKAASLHDAVAALQRQREIQYAAE